jgi:hypothetical protein
MIKLVAIRCKISRGGFSGERVFHISMGATNHSGIGSRLHMWNRDGIPIGEGEPPIGEEMNGLVAARVLQIKGDIATVTVPDGEVIDISVAELSDRPSVDNHVPVG